MADLDLLKSVPLFHNLPAAQFEQLCSAAIERGHAQDDVIFQHGDTPEFLYIIKSGAVDIILPTSAGEIIAASLEAGSFFGELAVFDRQPRTATARTASDTVLVCVPLKALAKMLDDYPPAARSFIGTIAMRLRSADEMLSRLQVRNLNEVADSQMTFGERIADKVARFGGSWTFIIAFGVFLLLWMGGNSVYLLTNPPDPFPYIFLNLILSCIAALQAPVIMMSQNRQAAKDRLQADQEFEINVKAEIAIQQLHRKLDELRLRIAQQHQSSSERDANPI
ncbi:MAG TPA: DUF1003 domain-containing protein [Stenotrophobium sp.]|jgi:uncharacterized membrane protein|nr:DUF1003 domain-containing protein [Stenotrophobium sp.]